MPNDQAAFDFEKFKVGVRYIGEEEGPAYETKIEAPGFEPAFGGVVLKRLPLFSSAARAAVSQFRRLLAEGVKAFLDDFRKNSGVISFKEIQDMRLVFLSWHDMASAIGDEALAAAEEELKAEEARESTEVYGKEQEEQKEEAWEPDYTYDLGSVVMTVRVMGMVGIFPLWGVTASIPGTDLHASTILGVSSPLPSHAAQSMVENLRSVHTLGIDRYLEEYPSLMKKTAHAEKRVGTEMLHAVASALGIAGIDMADQRIQKEVERERAAFLEQATAQEEASIAAMEAEIAERKKAKAQRKAT